jgi:ADP-ribose pyrophosphatase YjhB (NUDIX family)
MDALPLLEKLQAIAKLGLRHSQNIYDTQRYQQLLELTEEYYGHALEMPPAEVRERQKQGLELLGICPILGANAAIFDQNGKILLMKRTDNQKWCMPCGLNEVGESPEQAAVREAKEETGLDVRVLELVGVYTRFPDAEYTPYTLVSTVYLCQIIGGILQRSHEDLGLEYWHLDEVPVWHGNQEQQARDAFAVWQKRSDG